MTGFGGSGNEEQLIQVRAYRNCSKITCGTAPFFQTGEVLLLVLPFFELENRRRLGRSRESRLWRPAGWGISVKQRSYLGGGVRLNSSTVLGITQGNKGPMHSKEQERDFFDKIPVRILVDVLLSALVCLGFLKRLLIP